VIKAPRNLKADVSSAPCERAEGKRLVGRDGFRPRGGSPRCESGWHGLG
jgi:hypothetical protein